MSNNESPLRLRKKHGAGASPNVSAADGERLVRAQSARGAIMAALIAIIIFSVLWVTMSSLFSRVFPWMTAVLGYMIGYAVRYAGRGVDWYFPVIAASMALAGSLIANIVVAASVTADDMGISTVNILSAVTSMTWPVFFDEVWNIADGFFAIVSAALAAFFANRKLTRTQYFALRLWREEQVHD
ncbi:MAG: hypothetical protein K0U72_08335 [Gammaproteobacteria bacterium]|nr:hypothetical protein [Gammaproteobacteria bacterium]